MKAVMVFAEVYDFVRKDTNRNIGTQESTKETFMITGI
jgi:hypothetical protein